MTDFLLSRNEGWRSREMKRPDRLTEHERAMISFVATQREGGGAWFTVMKEMRRNARVLPRYRYLVAAADRYRRLLGQVQGQP